MCFAMNLGDGSSVVRTMKLTQYNSVSHSEGNRNGSYKCVNRDVLSIFSSQSSQVAEKVLVVLSQSWQKIF